MLGKTKRHKSIYEEHLLADYEEDGCDDNLVILKPVVGMLGSISFIVGSIIGTGIFISPTGVLEGVSGSVGLSIIVWLICGAISTCGAYCYVELGTIFKKSGGDFTFVDEIYGPMLGYVRVWITFFLEGPAWNSLQCIVVATYPTAPFVTTCVEAPYIAVRLVSVCVLMVTLFVNCFSTILATRFQIFYTIAKIIGLLVIILTGLVMIFKGETDNFKKPFAFQQPFDIFKLQKAFYAGFFAYSGWAYIITVIEEVKQPLKTLPRAMNISMVAVTTVYMLANIAYLTVLTPEDILTSDAVAATFAVRCLGSWHWLIWPFVALSASGTLNSALYTGTRVPFAASREGRFPLILSFIHVKYRTPVLAILLPIPLTIVFLCFANIWFIINFMGFVELLSKAMCIVIIPYIRWKQPDRYIPFKTNICVSLIALLMKGFLIVLTIISVPIESLIAVAFIVFAVFIYFLDKKITSEPAKYTAVTDKINNFLQKLFLSVPQEISTF